MHGRLSSAKPFIHGPGTDVAKEAAGIVLLDKDLSVLSQGITYGRTTYGNTIKRAPCLLPICPGMRSCI